jgi:phosphoenolpyruvate-protein phosphotransferase
MLAGRGRVAAPGFAEGRAYLYGQSAESVPRYIIAPEQVETERARFTRAIAQAAERLERLRRGAAVELGRADAEIFAAHVALLNDPQFVERVERRIGSDLRNAEQAIASVVEELAATLGAADDEYLRERAQDIRDLGRWVLRELAQSGAAPLTTLPERSVLVARELLPSDLLLVDRSNLAGIITEQGGEMGHAAILARALGIPYVIGVTGATSRIAEGSQLLVDGQTGEVWVASESSARSTFADHKRIYEREGALALAEEHIPCVTLDGVRVSLHANIGRVSEVADVVRHHLDGVGLFRTEYMFLDDRQAPSLERQRRVYLDALAALDGRPLVIRTLDLGGDKRPLFLAPHFETNPKLGLRGLRFSLTEAVDLFRTQLRAIIQASMHGDVHVLFPMVLGGHDLRQAITLIDAICRDERCVRSPRIGAMVETPAALFTLPEILELVDFVSIGTNDLTQFMLAADRGALDVLGDTSTLHPAVLRAVKEIVRRATAKNKPVTVCGEAAADPAVARILIGLGVRTLSMSPVSAARVRLALRQCRLRDLEQLARTALKIEDHRQIAQLARTFSG